MANSTSQKFTDNLASQSDGCITFSCSTDHKVFPWLALPVGNAILVQNIAYFTSVGLANANGAVEEGQWTALTKIVWRCEGDAAQERRPACGKAEAAREDGSPDFGFSIFDEAGALLYRLDGAGVIFRNRDFKSWRAKNLTRIMALPEPVDFRFAPPAEAGVPTVEECFVSSMSGGAQPMVEALVTSQSGFSPGHPWHQGSGDHVNASHQADAAEQAARVMRPDLRDQVCRRGEISFGRYVELNRPFQIAQIASKTAGGAIALELSQGGRHCTEILLEFGEAKG